MILKRIILNLEMKYFQVLVIVQFNTIVVLGVCMGLQQPYYYTICFVLAMYMFSFLFLHRANMFPHNCWVFFPAMIFTHTITLLLYYHINPMIVATMTNVLLMIQLATLHIHKKHYFNEGFYIGEAPAHLQALIPQEQGLPQGYDIPELIRIIIEKSEPCTSNDYCCICLEPLETKKCVTLACTHVYHTDCISQSIRLTSNKCCMCRAVITLESVV